MHHTLQYKEEAEMVQKIKNTLKKPHLQMNKKKGKKIKERNTCGYRGACISKDD